MSKIINAPSEFFGFDTKNQISADSELLQLRDEDPKVPYKKIICPFKETIKDVFDTGLGTFCDKIRKGRPNALIGNCSLSKYNYTKKENENWIVCPHRFLQYSTIFEDSRIFFNNQQNLKIVKEIKIGEHGSSDFMVFNNKNNEIDEILSIEIQSIGTSNTGDIWDARNDFLQAKLRDNYNFGINKKMSSKTILIQLLHKLEVLKDINIKILLVIQDYFLEHLRKNYEIDSNFRNQDLNDQIHIHSYNFMKNSLGHELKLKESISTDMKGLHLATKGKSSRKLEIKNIKDPITARLKVGKFQNI